MRTRTWIVLLLALGSGLIAGYAALQLVSNRQDRPVVVDQTSGFEIVVAAHDLPVGHIIGEEDVRMVGWPDNAVPVGYARQIPDVIGRGLIQPVMANEPILASKMADRGAGGGLPILIPEGMRAVALRVDDVIAVAGFVTAGTRVDLMLSMQPPGSSEMVTRTIMQNLEVATHGTVYNPDPQGNAVQASVVVIYVTPEQSEKLSLAQRQGNIQLALRNRLDVRETRTQGIRVSQLLSVGSAPTGRATTRSAPPPATTNPGNTLEVIRGSQRSIVRFGRGGGNQ